MRPIERVITKFAASPRAVDGRVEAFIEEQARPHPIFAIGCATAVAIPLFVVLALASWAVGYWWVALILGPALLLLPIGLAVWDRANVGARRQQATEIATTAPLVVACAVQANNRLYHDEDAYAGALLVYSTSPARSSDVRFVQWLAEQIRTLKGSPDPGGELTPLWRMVNNDRSTGRVQVAPSIAGDGATFLRAMAIAAKQLPGGDLRESDGLVPLVLVRGDLRQLPRPLVDAALVAPGVL